jgi:hypothetical protein
MLRFRQISAASPEAIRNVRKASITGNAPAARVLQCVPAGGSGGHTTMNGVNRWRSLAIILFVCGIAGLLWSRTADAGASLASVRVEVSGSGELRCDGDSARATVIVTGHDGAPLPDADVELGASGIIRARGTSGDGSLTARTDNRGEIRLRVTPTPGSTVLWYLFAIVPSTGASWYLPYGCPFPETSDFTIDGLVWNDADRDGTRDAGERVHRHLRVELQAYFYNLASYTPPHTTFSDSAGSFGWTGLWQWEPRFEGEDPRWRVCLLGVRDSASPRVRIVSVNGSPMTPDRCVRVLLAPGANVLSLGVAE